MTEIAARPVAGEYTGGAGIPGAYCTTGQDKRYHAIIRSAVFPTPQRLETLVEEYAEIVLVAKAQSMRTLSESTAVPITTFWRMISVLDAVESLYAYRTDDGYIVWTIVNAASEDDREAIYNREWALMEIHPCDYFDFHVLDREDESLSDLITFPPDALEFSRRWTNRALT